MAELQLDASSHPEISFQSTACRPGPAVNVVNVQGNLTIRGLTGAVEIPLRIRHRGHHLRAEGQLDILQTDFDVVPRTMLWGTFRTANRIEVYVPATAQREPSPRNASAAARSPERTAPSR